MCANDPLNGFDAFGDRQKGHHIIPEAVMRAICPNTGAGQAFWDKYLDVADGVIATPDHDYTAHGAYSKRVKQLILDYMKAKKWSCNCLGDKKAKKLLDLIKTTDDPYIRGFNSAVGGGIDAVEDWSLKSGRKILAKEATVASEAGAVVRYGRIASRTATVLVVGTFIYYASENGLQAAAQHTVADITFFNELYGGGQWLVDKTESLLTPLTQESCCRRNGLGDLFDDE